MPTPEKIIYSTRVTSTGGREDGNSKSNDDKLNIKLSKPTEMGGSGGAGTNPEQLFGAGYSACFLGAIKAVAGKQNITISDETTVTAEIGFGAIEKGYIITAELFVNIPDLDSDEAKKLVQKAHEVCPYSNATRNNVDVKLHVTNNVKSKAA